MTDLTTWARQYGASIITWDEFLARLREFQFVAPSRPDPWDDYVDFGGSIREIDQAVRLSGAERAEINRIVNDSLVGGSS